MINYLKKYQSSALAYPLFLGFLILVGSACKKENAPENKGPNPLIPSASKKISALDLSFYPAIAGSGTVYRDSSGEEIELLRFIKDQGVNTVRLRLWHSPEGRSSSLVEVDSMAKVLKSKGFKVWLCLHYSDSWADPGEQAIPELWQNLNYAQLQDSLTEYTAKVMRQIAPDIIQIGNEINSGILHPFGRISDQPQQFKELLSLAIQEVRRIDANCKIMLHNAGLSNAQWLYNELDSLDFDIIGLSYYPLWHGKDLSVIENNLHQLAQNFSQDILFAETAYPFTLDWNDWTNNVVGWDEHLILPNYPASPQGQKDFLLKIREMIFATPQGIGFSYWGGEWLAYRGDTATDGSSFENQALFDFDHKALPAWEAFDLRNF